MSKFNFEWLREGIPVGSGVGYIVKPADEGYRLWCAVTAIHEEPFKPPENTRAESFNSVLIPGKAPTSPTPSEPPLLSGQPAVNETLSCSTGGWSGNPQPTFTYQWLRDPGPEETLIEAATKPTYTVSSEDRGHALACRVTAHNSPECSSRAQAYVRGRPPPS